MPVPPPSSVDAQLEALPASERGFVLGATLLGLDAEAAAALVPGPAQRCRAALETLLAASKERKATRLAQLARDLGAPFPPGLELVHRSWLRRLLASEPAELRAVLISGAPPSTRQAAGELAREPGAGEGSAGPPLVVPPEMATELRRLVFAPLQIAGPVEGSPLAPLLAQDPAGLRESIRRLGARSLGASVAEAPPEVRARALAAVGPFAEDLRASAEAADKAARRAGEADVKAAAGETAATVEARLDAIGVAALARLAAGDRPWVRRALALRLPMRLGRRLLPEGLQDGPGGAKPGEGGAWAVS